MTVFKNKQILIMIISAFVSLNARAKIETVLGTPLASNQNLPGTFPSSADSEIILSRNEFVISYNKVRRSPNWVAWKLEASNLGKAPRVNAFDRDVELAQYLKANGNQYQAAETSDYDNSCFDRGHQSPSADHSNNPSSNKASFVMTNIIPQTAFLNRVIWEHLEKYTRDVVVKQNKKAYIIAGPIYDEDFGAIGPQKNIPVPSKNYKIIIFLDKKQTWKDIDQNTEILAVVMPNVELDGSKPLVGGPCKDFVISKEDTSDWKNYTSSVPEIQRLTGTTIFSKLP